MNSKNCSITLTIHYYIYIYIFYSSYILLQLIALLDLKYPSSSLLKPSFVDFWLVCIIFIGSEFIGPETCTRVWLKIFSGPYTNRTYIFSPPSGLWKVVMRVPILWLHLLPSIHWLASIQFLGLFKFAVL